MPTLTLKRMVECAGAWCGRNDSTKAVNLRIHHPVSKEDLFSFRISAPYPATQPDSEFVKDGPVGQSVHVPPPGTKRTK